MGLYREVTHELGHLSPLCEVGCFHFLITHGHFVVKYAALCNKDSSWSPVVPMLGMCLCGHALVVIPSAYQ